MPVKQEATTANFRIKSWDSCWWRQ